MCSRQRGSRFRNTAIIQKLCVQWCNGSKNVDPANETKVKTDCIWEMVVAPDPMITRRMTNDEEPKRVKEKYTSTSTVTRRRGSWVYHLLRHSPWCIALIGGKVEWGTTENIAYEWRGTFKQSAEERKPSENDCAAPIVCTLGPTSFTKASGLNVIQWKHEGVSWPNG